MDEYKRKTDLAMEIVRQVAEKGRILERRDNFKEMIGRSDYL